MKKLYDNYTPDEVFDTEVLGEESNEELLERLMRRYRYGIVCKTIISGEMLESEIYPCYERKDFSKIRRKKENTTREAQRNLNNKNAIKKITRLIHANFDFNRDLAVTLTYQDRYLPTEEQARKDMVNFIRRLKRARARLSLPEIKYIYVIGCEPEGKKSKKVRIHHHLIINDMDRDLVESLWNKGRVSTKRLQPDEFGLEGLARYMYQNKGTKRWYASRNLKTPVVRKSYTRLTRRKLQELALYPQKREELFEKLYRGKYSYTDCKVYISDITKGVYLYCKMRRRN